jgi:alkanesulfonate monooxygenase SsuD/methylene tetrahydromethanopterin reductase-like flavin-dependent oxidoreductase (luciferase family)
MSCCPKIRPTSHYAGDMRIGAVVLPDAGWPELRSRWVDAEQRGFQSIWTYDHLSWRSLRDGPWLGTIALLAAAAEATESVRLGTLVTTPNYRHPAVLAKDAMTLDQISGGRLDLGVGAGGTGFDATVLGQELLSPHQRAARFEEFVEALDILLSQPAASFSGEYFTAYESRTYPGCVQQPRVPFTIAAAGPRALRVAAHYASRWVTYGPTRAHDDADWFDAVAGQAARLDTECLQAGRDPHSLDRMLLVGLEMAWPVRSMAAWSDFCDRAASLGFTDIAIHAPRPHDQELPGPPPAVYEQISRSLSH